MRQKLTALLAAVLTVAALSLTTTVSAKKMAVPKMYMFGFAASFTDSIVHFTEIQEIDSAWVDTKTKFLLGRDSYTFQLRDYLTEKQQMPQRTCVVFFNQKKAKLEKKFAKMLKLYRNPKKGAQQFDVRMLDKGAFMFNAVNMSHLAEE